jgi:hypothetical protein
VLVACWAAATPARRMQLSVRALLRMKTPI